MAEKTGEKATLDQQTFGNPETGRFWQEAAAGKFLLKRCDDCSEHHWYPRSHCPHCGGERTEWVEASGIGTIYSFTVLPRAGNQIPAYVTLSEGVTMFTNIVDSHPDEIAIGAEVSLAFRKQPDGTSVPVFTLAGA